jgi:hypothetical protein
VSRKGMIERTTVGCEERQLKIAVKDRRWAPHARIGTVLFARVRLSVEISIHWYRNVRTRHRERLPWNQDRGAGSTD